MKDKLKGLNPTPEERAAIEKYIAWVDGKRRASKMAPLYAEIDRQYPELDPHVREELAEAAFSKMMQEYSLRRSQPKA